MKANQGARCTSHRDDRGVSVIVGAVLLTGILLSVTVVVRTSYVPVWEKEQEVDHMDEVGQKMAEVRSSIGSQVVQAGVADTQTIPLKPEPRRFVPEPLSHEISFEAGDKPVELGLPAIKPVAPQNGSGSSGQQSAVLEELPWHDISEKGFPCNPGENGTNSCYTGISELVHMRVNGTLLPETQGGGNKCDKYTDRIGVNVTPTDTDDVLANFYFERIKASPNCILNIRVVDHVENQTVYNNPVTIHQSNDQTTDFWVHVLNPDYQFLRLVERAEKNHPGGLDFAVWKEETGEPGQDIAGEVSIAFETTKSSPGSGGSGSVPFAPPKNMSQTFDDSGTLSYVASNDQFVRQEYVLENGVLALRQGEGFSSRSTPQFSVENTPSPWAEVVIDMPMLVGEDDTLSGPSKGTVSLQSVGHTGAIGLAKNVSLNVTTEFPELWNSTWQAQNGSFLNMTTETGADWASLQLNGLTSNDPNSANEFDLFLVFRQADIRVELSPG